MSRKYIDIRGVSSIAGINNQAVSRKQLKTRFDIDLYNFISKVLMQKITQHFDPARNYSARRIYCIHT